MGYYSSVTGDFILSRELTHSEIEKVRAAIEENWPYSLMIDEERVDTAEGVLIKRKASMITTDNADSGKYYDLESDTQRMIDALPSDVDVTGYVQRDGEETGDMERLYVKDRSVVSVKPVITWPVPE